MKDYSMRECSNCKNFDNCYWLMYCCYDPLTTALKCVEYEEKEEEEEDDEILSL